MKRLAIAGGRVFDPEAGIDGLFDIIAMGGRVASIRPSTGDMDAFTGDSWTLVDATGKLVLPGLIDIHTHLREPGFEYKETIASGVNAAAAGGFTAILCMANTEPVNDCASVTRYILNKAASASGVRVLPIGAVSVGLKGEKLSEMADLAGAGCVAFSDDGLPVVDGALMRRALEYSLLFGSSNRKGGGRSGFPVISHAEDPSIACSGAMNEGRMSTRLGLPGIPNAAEDSLVARDITLAELTGAHLHIAHVSTRGAVDLIRAAKARGVRVTAEVTPHHLLLDDSAVEGFSTDAKMSPPLRSAEDIEAVREGLRDGTIEAIATDHAPHSPVEKDIEFSNAANGIIGLETALGLTLKLVNDGVLPLETAVRALTSGPAKVMGLKMGQIKVGTEADFTIVDTEREWTVDTKKLLSKSKNTPFSGWKLKGAASHTIVGGEVIFSLKD